MRTRRALIALLLVFASGSLLSPTAAARAESPAAPYLRTVDGSGSLPLAMTRVDATIVGVIADVSIEQVFENRGRQAIEAVYVFPGSPRAAVSGLTMEVDGRRTEARIGELQQARREYEQAVERGQSAALLESREIGLFQMNVGNVPAGGQISVTLRYSELLVPEDGEYKFVVPTVTQERYGALLLPGQASVIDSDDPRVSAFALNVGVTIRAGMPLRSFDSPSHHVEVQRLGDNEVRVDLSPDDEHAMTRNFELNYRLAGNEITTGLLRYEDATGGYFLAMVQPPEHTRLDQVPAREFLFVIDVSGSMNGFPLTVSRELTEGLLLSLRPEDRFNVLHFDSSSQVLSPHSLPASNANIAAALKMMQLASGGGGTQLQAALERAYALPREDGMARIVLVLSDGQVYADHRLYDLVRSRLHEASVFSFGVGRTVNEQVMTDLARAGAGDAFIVRDAESAQETAPRFRAYVDSPLLLSPTVHGDGVDIEQVEPAPLPDLYARRPLIAVGRYAPGSTGRLRIEGRTVAGDFSDDLHWADAPAHRDNRALRVLWARERVARLLLLERGRNDAPQRQEITRLGVEHGLLTPYTAFVAVDAIEQQAPGQRPERVQQPLPTASRHAGFGQSEPEPIRVGRLPAYSEATASTTRIESGFAARTRAPAAAPAVPGPADDATVIATRAGRMFRLHADVWVQEHDDTPARIVRLRRDGAAAAALLARLPELREIVELGVKVRVVFGDTWLEIGPDGFETLSEHRLNELIDQWRATAAIAAQG